MKAKVLGKNRLGEGKFICLEQIEFQDERGRIRPWEGASRLQSFGAVLIVPHILPDDEYILVRQFRPPAGHYMIEFPAGLIDPGEDAATTAHRELLEETGYQGRITKTFPPSYSSPGMSGETITIIHVEVNGDLYRNNPPMHHQEDSENIEIIRIPRQSLETFLLKSIENGDGVDAKLWPFCK